MLTIKQIQMGLSDRNRTKVAKAIGVTPVWLCAIYNGQVTPSEEMQQRISDYLKQHRWQDAGS